MVFWPHLHTQSPIECTRGSAFWQVKPIYRTVHLLIVVYGSLVKCSKDGVTLLHLCFWILDPKCQPGMATCFYHLIKAFSTSFNKGTAAPRKHHNAMITKDCASPPLYKEEEENFFLHIFTFSWWGGVMLWYSMFNCRLQHWHPIQFHNAPGKAVKGDPRACAPDTHVGDPEGTRFLVQPDPALDVEVLRGVNQWVEFLSRSFPFSPSMWCVCVSLPQLLHFSNKQVNNENNSQLPFIQKVEI